MYTPPRHTHTKFLRYHLKVSPICIVLFASHHEEGKKEGAPEVSLGVYILSTDKERRKERTGRGNRCLEWLERKRGPDVRFLPAIKAWELTACLTIGERVFGAVLC